MITQVKVGQGLPRANPGAWPGDRHSARGGVQEPGSKQSLAGLRERALATLLQKSPAPWGQADRARAGRGRRGRGPACHPMGPVMMIFPADPSNLPFLLF